MISFKFLKSTNNCQLNVINDSGTINNKLNIMKLFPTRYFKHSNFPCLTHFHPLGEDREDNDMSNVLYQTVISDQAGGEGRSAE